MRYKVPYFPTLRRIRSFLEQQDSIPDYPPFPSRWCEETSWLVHRVASLSVVTGSYSVRGDQRGHFWNFDPERHLYIDLTQDQFGYTRRKIVILPMESQSPLTKWSIEYSYEDFYREDQGHNGVVDKLEKLYLGWIT